MPGFWSKIARAFSLGIESKGRDKSRPYRYAGVPGQYNAGTVDRIIVGLGNPGAKYARTRHNVGFMVLDGLAREASAGWIVDGGARTCRVEIAGCLALLIEPLMYMNRSGEVLPGILGKYGREARDIVVVLDDLSLPLGRIRVRERGSAGGHRGLESIMNVLDTDAIIRVRMGIGEEHMPKDKADYVLSDFPEENRAELDDMITQAGDAVKTILKEGAAQTMAIFNGVDREKLRSGLYSRSHFNQ